jgi:hypothetical protein
MPEKYFRLLAQIKKLERKRWLAGGWKKKPNMHSSTNQKVRAPEGGSNLRISGAADKN